MILEIIRAPILVLSLLNEEQSIFGHSFRKHALALNSFSFSATKNESFIVKIFLQVLLKTFNVGTHREEVLTTSHNLYFGAK